MDKLLHTSLYRAILKSLNRRKVPEHKLQIYLSEFVQQVTALCDEQNCLSALRILNYTQIRFQYLSCQITALSISRSQYISQFIDLALDVLHMEKELLYCRIEHPQPFISEPAFTSPLHWSKHYLRSVSRKFFADSIGWLCLLLSWQMVRPLRSIWLFGSSRIHYMLNSAIRPMSNAVFWNVKKTAQFTEALLYSLNKEDE